MDQLPFPLGRPAAHAGPMTVVETPHRPPPSASTGGDDRIQPDRPVPTEARSDAAAVFRDTWVVVGVVLASMALVASVVAWGFAAQAVSNSRHAGGLAPGGPHATVKVSMTEFRFEPQAMSASVGDMLNATNNGAVAHTLSIEGTSLVTTTLDPGKAAGLDPSSLKVGDYVVSCTIPGHKASGMTATLHLAAAGSGAGIAGGGTPEGGAMPGMESSSGAPPMSSAVMDRWMHDSTVAFPAKTAGLGGQALAPTILPDGTKRFEVTAKVVKWEKAPGQIVDAWTYDGVVPGPTIKVAVGDKVEVLLHNRLPESTVIHFHGVEVPNAMDGVPYITQDPVQPGSDFTYRFTARSLAVGMYHSHDDSTRQVSNGLAGAFLIGDVPVPASVGVPEAQIQKQVMFLDDAGTLGLTINGKSFPATAPVVAKVGEWLQVTYFNEGQMIHPMHLHGMAQMIIAKDGFPLANPELDDTVMVAPGQRYTVLVHATEVGTWVWHCHVLSHAENDQGMFGMLTALVVKS
ncbi:MAG: hypothetical protein NVSMB16_04400 [Acidimicrobiales bacterium]